MGKNAEERQQAYRVLFRGRIAGRVLKEIRDATNKSWVLGEDRFKAQIEEYWGELHGRGSGVGIENRKNIVLR
jgi:putative transposase